jgi:drug/metabolite transporter (DMT)-like permease
VAFGLVLVALDRSAEGDPLWATLVMRSTSLSIWIVALVVLRPALRVRAADLGPLALIGVIDTGANALFSIASTRDVLSITAVLAQLYPIVTVLLARIVLGERIARSQQAGVAAAFTGIALITAG